MGEIGGGKIGRHAGKTGMMEWKGEGMRGMACLHEEQVEQLIRCDCSGCRRRVWEGEPPVLNWRRQVLDAVNRALRDLFCTAGAPRTPWQVFQSLRRHWPADSSLFPDQNTYYTVWVKVTDHFMRYVVSNQSEDPPILLMEWGDQVNSLKQFHRFIQ